jgi:arginine N-succinyltransferase
MDYPAAEQLASGPQRTLIAELLPQSPIYVPLLPEEAQWSLGQLHPVAELPFQILLDEGWTPTPTSTCSTAAHDGGPSALLRSVAGRRVHADAQEACRSLRKGCWLVANDQVQDFRASICAGPVREEDLAVLAGRRRARWPPSPCPPRGRRPA